MTSYIFFHYITSILHQKMEKYKKIKKKKKKFFPKEYIYMYVYMWGKKETLLIVKKHIYFIINSFVFLEKLNFGSIQRPF